MYDLFGCADPETPLGAHDFYEIVETATGDTLNLGDGLWHEPTDVFVARYVRRYVRRTLPLLPQ